ncbi:mucin-1-like [Motacilla alba alba]|uniref:mucin-1-like n=1 Tax=Motacilla alba alba TaxID=1094192 RepID=UPI0018D514D4|nr:mucin-1-like [Motacilla alba alba]
MGSCAAAKNAIRKCQSSVSNFCLKYTHQCNRTGILLANRLNRYFKSNRSPSVRTDGAPSSLQRARTKSKQPTKRNAAVRGAEPADPSRAGQPCSGPRSRQGYRQSSRPSSPQSSPAGGPGARQSSPQSSPAGGPGSSPQSSPAGGPGARQSSPQSSPAGGPGARQSSPQSSPAGGPGPRPRP